MRAPLIKCSFLILPEMKECKNPAVAMIHKAGYCQEHLAKAEKLLGPSKKILREELFAERKR